MLFIEKKTKAGFEYETEQFVGYFKFISDKKIPNNVLDNLVFTLTKDNVSQAGKTKWKGQDIEYEFTSRTLWEDDNEKENV
jgi:hypothetical protein